MTEKKSIFTSAKAIAFAIVMFLIVATCGMWVENVDKSKITVCQYPTGTLTYWTQPGPRLQLFGTITDYDKSAQVWFSNREGEGDGEGLANGSIKIMFNDGGTARISGSIRIELPTNSQQLERITTKFPTMDNLMSDLVIPTVYKAVLASGPMMTAYESYAEKKNDLMRYIDDQISNGVYQTVIREVRVQDEVSGDEKVVRVAFPIEDSTAVNNIKRQELPPFQEFGIRVVQVALNDIDYDEIVKAQISRQQQILMDMKTSYSDALKAKQDAIKAEEMGKATAAEERWKQEAIKAVEVTRAQQAFEVAEFRAKEASEAAKKIKAEGEAEAYSARLKVQAGLSPLEKAQIEKDKAIGVAAAIAGPNGITLPKAVMSGGQGSGNTAMDAMGMKMIMDIIDKLSKAD